MAKAAKKRSSKVAATKRNVAGKKDVAAKKNVAAKKSVAATKRNVAAKKDVAAKKSVAATKRNVAAKKDVAAKKSVAATKRNVATKTNVGTKIAPQDVAVYPLLRAILEKHARDLIVTRDDGEQYHLDTKTVLPNKKPLYFGGVRAGRAYTSFYLMPVYVAPELLDGISDGLRERMQGKSCFNFKTADQPLIDELRVLTGRAYTRWKKEGKL
jgi:hypothetical protein